MLVIGASELNVSQGCLEPLRDRTSLAVTDRKPVRAALDLADRRHHGGRAAGESLRQSAASAPSCHWSIE